MEHKGYGFFQASPINLPEVGTGLFQDRPPAYNPILDEMRTRYPSDSAEYRRIQQEIFVHEKRLEKLMYTEAD